MVGLCYRSKVIGVTLTLLMLATSVVALGIHPIVVVHALSVIIVPDDYATIQDAIGNATAGDTIYVRAGTYYGGLAISKPLTLEGESNKNTIVLLSYSQSPYPTTGLWIGASNVTVSGFHFVSNASYLVCMIGIDGRSSVANNDVFMDNIVEGKPTLFVYPPGSSNYEYPDPIVAISSQGDRIVGNTVLPGGSGFGLASTITLDGADNCLVAENNVTEGWVGILVMGNNNIVGLNHVADTTDFNGWQCGGITLDMGTNNTVVGNTLINNTYGVSCWSSHYNTIYHNNFIDNKYQAYSSSLNSWDNGYPSGGNYWSDYNGTDAFMGPYQNVTGSDGIGDTQMTVASNVVDHYPLVNPVKDFVGDVNLDGKVDVKDVAVVARSFGLTAGDLNWNLLVDLNGDNRIDILDLAIVARNFGKSWL